ncbi:MAG TPA: PadR family transcriptional regulator, partial [Acidimicrobiales bacterium]
MGHPGFNRQWARNDEPNRRQRRGTRRGGPWGDFGGWDGPGRQGPPPWAAGLFGLSSMHDQRRGPRVRRGDVRSAILDVLRTAEAGGEQVNGYQVIQQIAERSDGAWRPSPGSVYPTIQQLQDEGLVETDDGARSRRSLTLTDEGRQYASDHA